MQIAENAVESRGQPETLAALRSRLCRTGQAHALIGQPVPGGRGRLQPLESLEHALDGLGHRCVGIQRDRAVLTIDQPDRQAHTELTAPCLVANPAVQAADDVEQLDLAELALEPEQDAVIELAGIVDTGLVQDQRVGVRGQLEQSVPVGVVAGQARDLQAQHHAHLAHRHGRYQQAEAIAVASGCARLAEIVVNHTDLIGTPAKANGPVLQCVLAPRALGVLLHLAQRRLADVDDGVALEVPMLNLAAREFSHGLCPFSEAVARWERMA